VLAGVVTFTLGYLLQAALLLRFFDDPIFKQLLSRGSTNAGACRSCPVPLVPILATGASAPDFDLPGVDGRRYTLKDFAAAQVLAILFTSNYCPRTQAYEDVVIKLNTEYAPKGVALVAISPNDPAAVPLFALGESDVGDSLEDMKVRAKDKSFKFPYLYDGETQAAARAYGPLAMPHLFIFDTERKLRFSRSLSPDMTGDVSYARLAFDALLDGAPAPSNMQTAPNWECPIAWADDDRRAIAEAREWAAEPVTLALMDAAGLQVLARNDDRNLAGKHAPKLRLISVWATTCQACVNEIADLVTTTRMYRDRDFELATVSTDPAQQRDAVLSILTDRQASGRNFQFEGGDTRKMAEALDPKWDGSLPHRMLIAPTGKVVYRSTGLTDPLTLRRAIVGYLGRHRNESRINFDREMETQDLLVGRGATAARGDTLTVHYVGTLLDGTKLASTFDTTRYDFPLGQGAVIAGWDQGLRGMKVGGKRRLTIPPALAYGGEARPGIPANSTLIYDIELLSIASDDKANTDGSRERDPSTRAARSRTAQGK
jgi:thiol-disulfide isomerase/thioredoxin